MTTPPPGVRGVLETCLYAEELRAAADFYEKAIGLVRFAAVDERHVFFRCGRGVFLLFNPLKTAEDEGEVPTHGAIGPGHVAFSVTSESLGEWRAHLDRCDVPIEREVRWPRGGLSLYLRDPAGNSVELATPTIWSLPED